MNKIASTTDLPDYDDEITDEQIAYIRKLVGPLPEGPVVVLTSLLIDVDASPVDPGEATALFPTGD